MTWSFFNNAISLQIGAYFVSLACGLQNGICTTFSGAVIRTTHVTGILTDIGLVLGQALFHRRTRKHLWKMKVLLPLYIAFCAGGLLGWFAYQLLLIRAILIPGLILALSGIAHLSYCKIISSRKIEQINRKHWKRNNANKNATPANQPSDHEQNSNEKTLINAHPPDLQMISVHPTDT